MTNGSQILNFYFGINIFLKNHKICLLVKMNKKGYTRMKTKNFVHPSR